MSYDEHRDEFKKCGELIIKNVRECLNEHTVLPSSITVNLENVGMCIQFYKLPKDTDEVESPEEIEFSEQVEDSSDAVVRENGE